MGNAHEDLLRKATDLLNQGDMDAFLAVHTPNVVFHVSGNNAMSGDHVGRDGVAAVFGKLMGILDSPPSFDIHDCLANDEHGILLGVQHLSRGGNTLDARSTLVFHFDDDMVSEIWLQPLDQDPVDSLLA
ncbi:MAG: nuclear transport factor 2 family protein [Actinomycetota bacterium]